jgi:hypothetical protein
VAATEKERTGWSLTRHFETGFMSDHPVCAEKGSFATFFDRASTPPHGGGECSLPEHYFLSFGAK